MKKEEEKMKVEKKGMQPAHLHFRKKITQVRQLKRSFISASVYYFFFLLDFLAGKVPCKLWYAKYLLKYLPLLQSTMIFDGFSNVLGHRTPATLARRRVFYDYRSNHPAVILAIVLVFSGDSERVSPALTGIEIPGVEAPARRR